MKDGGATRPARTDGQAIATGGGTGAASRATPDCRTRRPGATLRTHGDLPLAGRRGL